MNNQEKEKKYSAYLKSSHWSSMKWRIRNGRKVCEACRSGIGLEVHHLTYKRLGRELLTDLVLLCGKCHERVHQEQKSRYLTIPEATRFVLDDEKAKYLRGNVIVLPPKSKNETIYGPIKERRKNKPSQVEKLHEEIARLKKQVETLTQELRQKIRENNRK